MATPHFLSPPQTLVGLCQRVQGVRMRLPSTGKGPLASHAPAHIGFSAD